MACKIPPQKKKKKVLYKIHDSNKHPVGAELSGICPEPSSNITLITKPARMFVGIDEQKWPESYTYTAKDMDCHRSLN